MTRTDRQTHVYRLMPATQQKELGLTGTCFVHVKSFQTEAEAIAFVASNPGTFLDRDRYEYIRGLQ